MIEKSSQATVWSQSNMWSLTDVDNIPLTRLHVLGDAPWCSETQIFMSVGFTIIGNCVASTVRKFKEITVEPGKEINLLLQHEGKLIEFLKRVKSSVTIDLYKQLYPQASQPGIMYRLSKIHRPVVNGFPKLRPILPAINTGTYKWAKNFLFVYSNYLLLTTIKLRTPLITSKTLLNKVPNQNKFYNLLIT